MYYGHPCTYIESVCHIEIYGLVLYRVVYFSGVTREYLGVMPKTVKAYIDNIMYWIDSEHLLYHEWHFHEETFNYGFIRYYGFEHDKQVLFERHLRVYGGK